MVTISNGTNTFTFNDGDIESVEVDNAGEIDVIPLPGSGSSDAILSDINGVVKKLSVRGKLTLAATTRVVGQNIYTIQEQKDWLEGLMNGQQTSNLFTSTYESVSVMIEKISFTEVEGETNTLGFTMSLVAGS